jgi:hypothetical protein
LFRSQTPAPIATTPQPRAMHGVNLCFPVLLISYFLLRAPILFHSRSFVSVPGGFNRSNSVLLTSVDSITVSCRTSFATTRDYEALVGSAGADVALPETP